MKALSTPPAIAASASVISRAYLRHLYASNELLAQVLNTVHNLHYYLATMRTVRAVDSVEPRPCAMFRGREIPVPLSLSAS